MRERERDKVAFLGKPAAVLPVYESDKKFRTAGPQNNLLFILNCIYYTVFQHFRLIYLFIYLYTQNY